MKAELHTAKGVMNIDFYDADAPNTVKNFTDLAKKGFYDGLTFHRVVPDTTSIVKPAEETSTTIAACFRWLMLASTRAVRNSSSATVVPTRLIWTASTLASVKSPKGWT